MTTALPLLVPGHRKRQRDPRCRRLVSRLVVDAEGRGRLSGLWRRRPDEWDMPQQATTGWFFKLIQLYR